MSRPTLLDRQLKVIADFVARDTAEHEKHAAYWPRCIQCQMDLAKIIHERERPAPGVRGETK